MKKRSTTPPSDLPDVPKMLRMLGDKIAREYAENAGITLEESRTCDLKTIREEWQFLKQKGVIPNGLLMREFHIGWRGAALMVKHGTASGYNRGCRCKLCKAAIAAAQRNYYQRRKEKAAISFAKQFEAIQEAARVNPEA